MRTFTCPACGATVTLKSAVTVFAVCEYCRASLLNNGVTVEHLGQMAMLQEDSSPLQLGTGGKYQKLNFSLIGRVQKGWARGKWNEWRMLFDDGSEGWLAEAQGFYGVCRECGAEGIPPLAEIEVGTELRLDGASLRVDDIKQNSVIYSEGELPFKALSKQQATTVDLVALDGAFGSIEFEESGTVRAYTGHYLEYEDLSFSHVRPLDGW